MIARGGGAQVPWKPGVWVAGHAGAELERTHTDQRHHPTRLNGPWEVLEDELAVRNIFKTLKVCKEEETMSAPTQHCRGLCRLHPRNIHSAAGYVQGIYLSTYLCASIPT